MQHSDFARLEICARPSVLGESNRLRSQQVDRASFEELGFVCHGALLLSIAFKMTRSLQAHATRATLGAFPAAQKATIVLADNRVASYGHQRSHIVASFPERSANGPRSSNSLSSINESVRTAV